MSVLYTSIFSNHGYNKCKTLRILKIFRSFLVLLLLMVIAIIPLFGSNIFNNFSDTRINKDAIIHILTVGSSVSYVNPGRSHIN